MHYPVSMSVEASKEIESCGYHSVRGIGEGSFSRVYSAVSVEGRSVAIKYLRSSIIEDPIEIDVLFRLRHPNLAHGVRLLSPSDCQVKSLALALPLANTNGRSILEQWQYDYHARIVIIHQVCCGLEFLHRNGIVHLDVKPDNILLSGSPMSPTAYLSDFGLAGYLCGERFLSTRERVTSIYRAPEYFSDLANPVFKEGVTKSYRKSADVWAMGATIWAFISGKDLALNSTDLAAVFSLLSDPVEKREILDNMMQGLDHGAELQDLLSRMLEMDETRRITMKEVVTHPVFRNLPSCALGTLDMSKLPARVDVEDVENRLAQLCALVITKVYGSLRVEALFLAVDLLYLCADITFTESTLSYHLIAILQLSLSLLALEEGLTQGTIDVAVELAHALSLRERDEEIWKMVQKEVIVIITHLDGRLYRRYLYAACQSFEELEFVWESFVRYPEQYFDFTPSDVTRTGPTVDLSQLTISRFLTREEKP